MSHSFPCGAGRALGTVVAFALPWSAGTLASEPKDMTPPGPAAVDTSPESLAGPKVVTKPSENSIVRRDAMGKLIVPEANPAQAALELLTLTDAEKIATRAVIVARSRAFDEFFQAHTGEIVNIVNDLQSGNTREGIAASLQLMKTARSVKELGPLTDQLAAALPTEKASLLRKHVDEYTSAAMASERAEAKAAGEPTDDTAVAARLTLKNFGNELKAAYERTLVQGAADFEKFIKELDLSSQQEAKLRTLVQDAATRGEPGVSQRERTAIFMELWRDLSAKQRKKLAAAIRDRGGR